ncbi:hypothetical protein BDP27DRAFT_1252978 [Rhodocollybia butyracea]|uniref:Glucose receptor Git3 N-terminal domain-containing protein n=1 Tax=Rhodocollybia butyracea TaxID=206335 RepID=A0A9P5UF80_9AGAR|nr:hypothetical protein BDP27DRAFT_1252978 [Rhodocollybia butyracea]
MANSEYWIRDVSNSTLSNFVYTPSYTNGVICIAVTGLVSLIAILCLLVAKPPKPGTYHHTYLFGYLLSLLFANALLSGGSAMSLEWITLGEVTFGPFCTAQAALKLTGSVATALWSFMIAFHLFKLLFLRSPATKLAFWITIIVGWGAVIAVVMVGPMAIQKNERGPYFGITGPWCWINDAYPQERKYLEYFLELLSAGLSIILNTIVLLRVRGNLVVINGKWKLRHIPSSESWRLAIDRDLIDSNMLKFAQSMVWFPVAYTVLLLPVTITRLNDFAGQRTPFAVIVFTDVLYNMIGLVTVILLITTRRYYPDLDSLPDFNTQRNQQRESTLALAENGGVRPFTLERSLTAESYQSRRALSLALHRDASTSSIASSRSAISQGRVTITADLLTRQVSVASASHSN